MNPLAAKPIKHLKYLLRQTGIVGYMFFFFCIFYKLIQRGRGVEDVATVDSSAKIQIVYLGVWLYFAYKNSKKYLSFPISVYLKSNPLRFFVYYLLWAGVTILWSTQPLYSGYRLYENFAYLYIYIFIISCFGNRLDDAVHFILYYGIFHWSVNIFWHLKYGGEATLDSLHGQGALVVAPYLFLALYYPTRSWIKIWYIIITILTTATTMYLTTALIALIALFTSRQKFLHACIIVMALIFAMNVGREQATQTLFAGKTEDSIKNGSGRAFMYQEVYNAAMQKPWTGWGFCNLNGAFAQYDSVFSGLNIQNTHNCFLEAFVTTGYLGVVLLASFFLSLIFKSMIKLKKNKIYLPLFYSGIAVTCVSALNPSVSGRVFGAWGPVIYITLLLIQTEITERQVFN